MTLSHTLTRFALLAPFLFPVIVSAQALTPAQDPDGDGVVSAVCTPQPDFCSPVPDVCVPGPEACTGEGESVVCAPGADVCTSQPDICTPMPEQCAPLSAPSGDNCPDILNPDQADVDADLVGDVCDETPNAESILRVVVTVINDHGGNLTPEQVPVHVNVAPVPVSEVSQGGFFSRIARLFGVREADAATFLMAPATFPGNASGTDVSFDTAGREYQVAVDAVPRYTLGMEGCPNGAVGVNQVVVCTITFDDIYSFGSGYGDYPALPQYVYGCTDPLAKNYRPDNTRDDGSCYFTNATSTGSVLGASTDVPDLPLPAGCSPHLKAYLKQGRKNDPEEVKKLQAILNDELGAALPVTGFFGNLTKRWVKMYQKKFESEILKPWIDAGYGEKGGLAASGYAFITTRRHINIAKCEALKVEPMPALVPDVNP